MATITHSDTGAKLSDPDQVREYLAPLGIWYENWPVEGRLPAEATSEQILETYSPEIERLKQQGGYVTADVINVSPATPSLDAMLARFDKGHIHDEDEVRFTVSGRGVFWINPTTAPVFSIEVSTGDLINVPAGTRHWFHLCGDRHIRCIRLFQDSNGWAPHYNDDAVHAAHPPVCWGSNYLPVGRAESAVRL